MQLSSVRLALTFLALASGSALSQLDSVSTRIDTAAPSLPAVPARDSLVSPVAPSQPADSSSVSPVAVEKPKSTLASVASAGDSGCPHRSWSFEATTSYGWRMGQLLREEDRLTRAFKVVLIGKHNDTSNVRPVASGTMVQAAAWWKATSAQQIGLGFGFGRFYEHPVSSYNSDLSETLLDQSLVTARYRYSREASKHLRLFGEAAVGWNHSRIERIPLVAAHRTDDRIKFKQSQLDQIAALHAAQTVEGIHGQAGLGVQIVFPQSWSISLSGATTWDRLWFDRAMTVKVDGTSSDPGVTLSASPAYWGFDLGLSVARDF